MPKWFCYVTCFTKPKVFFLSNIFLSWVVLQRTSSKMLSVVHRWGYCWKFAFDTGVKIKLIFCHNDREQFGFYKKSTSQNTEQKEGCSCNLYIERNEEF